MSGTIVADAIRLEYPRRKGTPVSTAITKHFITNDPRFDLAERCLRALLPGAVLFARYAADAPRGPSALPPPLADGTQPPPEPGPILDDVVPERVELAFMPPPGLDFDSRHPMFGVMELAEVLVEAKQFILDQLPAIKEEIARVNVELAAAGEPLVVLHSALYALWCEQEAAALRSLYFAAKLSPEAFAGQPLPSAEDVITAEETARNELSTALADLRMEQATCLAPAKDTRKEEEARAAADAKPLEPPAL